MRIELGRRNVDDADGGDGLPPGHAGGFARNVAALNFRPVTDRNVLIGSARRLDLLERLAGPADPVADVRRHYHKGVDEGFPVVCLDSRHVNAASSAMTVKTNRIAVVTLMRKLIVMANTLIKADRLWVEKRA